MQEKRSIGISIYCGFVTLLMTAATIACLRLTKENVVWNLKATLSLWGISGLAAAAVGVMIFYLKKLIDMKVSSKREKASKPLDNILWISWPIIFVCEIPGFLAYYPANLCYDIVSQIGQITDPWYNDHHPLAHTLLIKFFWETGKKLFGSDNLGFAIMCVCQMILVSGAFAYSIAVVYKLTRKNYIFVLLTVLAAIYPFNFYMSISITKDVPFSAGFVVCFASIAYLLMSGDKSPVRTKPAHLLLFIGGVFVMLFRNNGRYSWLFSIGICSLFILFAGKKRVISAKLFVNMLASFIVGFVILTALSRVTNAEGGDKREMFSLPAQQIARSMNNHLDEIDDETREIVERIIWPEALYSYRPDIADPVKKDVISWEILHNPKMCANIYFKLLKDYPSEYINAFLELYAGFLSPLDTTHAYINDNGEGVPVGLHYVQTVFYKEYMDRDHIEQTPVSNKLHDVYEAYANGDGYLKIPVLSLIFVPGTFLWAFLYTAGICVYKKKTVLLLPLAMVCGYFATLFLGPTVQLRYIYPIMLCLPIAIACLKTKDV